MFFLFYKPFLSFFVIATKYKKGDPKASFFSFKFVMNYFTMNFCVSVPAFTK